MTQNTLVYLGALFLAIGGGLLTPTGEAADTFTAYTLEDVRRRSPISGKTMTPARSHSMLRW